MGEGEPLEFAVRGVVRNGCVVLDAPLAAPDGTVVTIRPWEQDDLPAVGAEVAPMVEEQLRWLEEDIAWLNARAAHHAAETKTTRKAA